MKSVLGWNFPDADDFMTRQIDADGRYQGSHLDEAMKYVTDHSLAVDAGAHVGLWSRQMAKSFECVIAVEPSPDTFEALTANMQAFGCSNVELRQMALGAGPGFVSMTLDAKGASMKNTGARYVETGGSIPMEAIDAWELPSLGFLKLDVEGSEHAALLGARQTLKRCHPVVLYENKALWRRFGVHRDAPKDLLTGLGYRQVAAVSKDEIWAVKR